MRKCKVCGTTFYAMVREGKKLSYAYCSKECRQKTIVPYEKPKLTGARSELVVSADRPHIDCVADVCNGYQITYLNGKDLTLLDMD